MVGNFHFVDALGANRASKRQARRHVMKGKNAGRTIRRGAKREVVRRQSPGAATPIGEGDGDRETRGLEVVVSPTTAPRYLGSQMLTVAAPVRITSYAMRVVNQFYTYVADRVYPVQLGITLEDTKRLWLQLLLSDEATYYCTIALLQACNQIFFLGGRTSQEELHHLSQAYAHIKERLQGPDALSDSTIAIVVAFAHQEQIRGGRSQAQIHLEGLRRMVQLRGGIGALEGNLPLTLKLCKTDVIFTLQYGGRTAFFRDNMHQVRDSLFVGGPLLDHIPAAPAPTPHQGLDPRLEGILADALHVSSVFNSRSQKCRASLVAYQEIVLSILYRLLDFHPLQAPPLDSGVEAAYHTGLTVFIMTVFLQHQHHRFVDLRLTLGSLREVFETTAVEVEGELALWALVVGGIWMWDHPEEEWIAPRIRGVSRGLGIASWDGARSVLKRFPWIDRIHDESGRKVWERAHEYGQLQQTALCA